MRFGDASDTDQENLVSGGYDFNANLQPSKSDPTPASPSSLPSWAIPAMIGSGALVALFVLSRGGGRRRRSRR